MTTTHQHKPGYWSAVNPIPTVQKLLENLDENKAERDRQIDEFLRRRYEEEHPRRHLWKPEEWKEERKVKGEQEQEAETEVVDHAVPVVPRRKGRTVVDPTTRKEIEIDDVDKEYMKAVKSSQLNVPNANLRKPTPIKTDPCQPWDEYRRNQDMTAPPDPIAEGTTSDVPIRGERTNILFHPTPSVSYEPMFRKLETRGALLCGAILFSIVVLGKKLSGGSFKGLLIIALFVVSVLWLGIQQLIRMGRAFEWSSEKLRGQTATANLLPESVEWMNNFLAVFWGLINPDMFASVADTIEDVMQASVPKVIENVRVVEIDQGSNPFRILSLRALPENQVQDLKENMREDHLKSRSSEAAVADEESGTYYNLECSFAYHATATNRSSATRAKNMHMLLVFYLGIKGLFGIPFPIFAELNEFVATVRLRLQLSPEPPFAKALTFSLMGLPHVKAGCTPMFRSGINVLNLPLISNFVTYAIAAASSLYVAPKSMTIDLAMVLGGDDVQKDTYALGALWVKIHRATGLSKQDPRGSVGGGSDPYINLSFSKYGKPMYCTRVICDDLNPIWEESTALLVMPEFIKADEQLSVELWDSDRHTADDIVGKIHISLQKLIQNPGKVYSNMSKLEGMDVGSEMPGELLWEVGYFPKTRFRPALRTDGKDLNLPETLKDLPALQDDKGNIIDEEQDAVTHTPPDPIWPSGICSVIIHQIVNLQFASIKGTYKNPKGREFEPPRGYGENTEEEGKNLPTSYCTILFDDQLIYRTRAKAVSSKPIFNAGTESFIRDWRSAIITVTVRDQRHREHDPILGVIPLKLSDILQTSSQVTRWYPLGGGIGYGRIRIALLFRSLEMRLPPQMLGWSVGTFKVVSDRITAVNFDHLNKIRIRCTGVKNSLRGAACGRLEEGKSGSYVDLGSPERKQKAVIPVKYRYRSAIIFELRGDNTKAYATLWLNDLVDNEDMKVDIPIWRTKMEIRLVQNHIVESNWQLKRSPGLEDLAIIGRLQFTCRFAPGFSESHERLIQDSDGRESFESWESCISRGVRDRRVSGDLPESIKQLHERSLKLQRDILRREASESYHRGEDRENKNEFDWVQEAFGEDFDSFADVLRQLERRDPAIAQIDVARSSSSKAARSTGSQHAEPSSQPRDAGTETDTRSKTSSESGGSNGAVVGMQNGPGPGTSTTSGSQRASTNHDRHCDFDGERGETSGEQNDIVTISGNGAWQDQDGALNNNNVDGVDAHDDEEPYCGGNETNKRTEHRNHRGVMQWRPARNAAFAKHQATFAFRKVKRRFVGDLTGREPDIETERG